MVNGLRGDLSRSECDAFEIAFPNKEQFVADFNWAQMEGGGMSADMAVLLSSTRDLGMDYCTAVHVLM